MQTLNGIFQTQDAALGAAERVREVASSRATVRLFLPGAKGKVIETSVAADHSSVSRVAMACVAVGLAGVVLFAFAGARLSYVLVWLMWAVAGGAMLAAWLTGELHPRHILKMGDAVRSRYERETCAGRAVVTVMVGSQAEAGRVTRTLEDAGARVVEGFFQGQASQRESFAS